MGQKIIFVAKAERCPKASQTFPLGRKSLVGPKNNKKRFSGLDWVSEIIVSLGYKISYFPTDI